MKADILANYQEPQAAFARLWEQDCRESILLLHGKSGSGKTSLLKHCRRNAPDNACQIFVDCKQDGINAADVFSRAADRIGWEKLPEFRDHLAGQIPHVEIRDTRIEGDGNRLNAVLLNGSPQEREERRILLTDAWLRDTDRLESPILLAIDTYEKAGDDLRTWLNSVIVRLPRVERQLRLVVAGQEIPCTDTCEDWTDCCNEQELYGVPEAEHWLPVVKALGLRVPADPPLTYLAGICHAMQGNPARIKEIIKTFPHLR